MQAKQHQGARGVNSEPGARALLAMELTATITLLYVGLVLKDWLGLIMCTAGVVTLIMATYTFGRVHDGESSSEPYSTPGSPSEGP